MNAAVWNSLAHGWQFGLPGPVLLVTGGGAGDQVVLDLCEAALVSLMPTRALRSLMPIRTLRSLMPQRTLEDYCVHEEE